MCVYINKYAFVDVYTCISQCEVCVCACMFELLLLPFNVIAIHGVAAAAPSCCVVQRRSGSSTVGINLPHPRGRPHIMPSH